MSSASLRKSRTNVSVFSRVDAVEPRERLHGREPDERLVHVHRVQQRLVEAGLELLGDDQHLVVGPSRTRSAVCALGEAVHAGLGEVDARAVDRPCRRTRRAPAMSA